MHNYYGRSYRGEAVGAPRSTWGMSGDGAFSAEIRDGEHCDERSGEAAIKAWRGPPEFHRGIPVKHTKALAMSFLREYSRARRPPKMVVEDTERCLDRMLDGSETIRDLGLNSWGHEGLVRALVYIAAKGRGLLCHDNLPLKLLARTKELMRMRGMEPEARAMVARGERWMVLNLTSGVFSSKYKDIEVYVGEVALEKSYAEGKRDITSHLYAAFALLVVLGLLSIRALERRVAKKTPSWREEEEAMTEASVVIKADDVVAAIERRAKDVPLPLILEEIAEALPHAGMERQRLQEALDRMAASPGQPRIARSGRYYGLRRWEDRYQQSIEHLALMRVALDHMVLRGIVAKPYYAREEGMPDILGRAPDGIIRVECVTGGKEYMPIRGAPKGKSIKLVLEAQLKLHRLFAEAPKATPRGKTAFNNVTWLVLRDELYQEFEEFIVSGDYLMWNMKGVFEEYYDRDLIIRSGSMLEASVAGSK